MRLEFNEVISFYIQLFKHIYSHRLTCQSFLRIIFGIGIGIPEGGKVWNAISVNKLRLKLFMKFMPTLFLSKTSLDFICCRGVSLSVIDKREKRRGYQEWKKVEIKFSKEFFYTVHSIYSVILCFVFFLFFFLSEIIIYI